MAPDVGPTGGKLWARPIVRVSNLTASLRYYIEKLGFARDWLDSDNPPAVAQVSRPGVTLMLDESAYWPKPGAPSVISLTLNDLPQHPALDALHREFVAAGAAIAKAPFKIHWDPHVFEMVVEDPDGNVLLFWGHVQ